MNQTLCYGVSPGRCFGGLKKIGRGRLRGSLSGVLVNVTSQAIRAWRLKWLVAIVNSQARNRNLGHTDSSVNSDLLIVTCYEP